MNEYRPAFLLWVDLESTGLDPQKDDILELYFVVTSFESPFLTASYASSAFGHYLFSGRGRDRLLAGECNAFVAKMHEKSGLRAELEKPAENLTTLSAAEDALLSLSADWPGVDVDVTALPDEERRAVTDSRVVIGGNSAHFDLSFLRVYLPRFARRLSHRIFDVSAMSLLARSLGMPRLPKSERHRAKQDVEESVLQARIISSWLDAPASSRNYEAFSDDSYAFARKFWHTTTYGKTAGDGPR